MISYGTSRASTPLRMADTHRPTQASSLYAGMMNEIICWRVVWSNDQKLSHGHRSRTPAWNTDNRISYHRLNCKGGGRWLQRSVRHRLVRLLQPRLELPATVRCSTAARNEGRNHRSNGQQGCAGAQRGTSTMRDSTR